MIRKATHVRQFCAIRGALEFGASADIGQAKLEDGSIVFMTWGRNLTAQKAAYWAARLEREIVHVGQCREHGITRENYEILLPAQTAARSAVREDRLEVFENPTDENPYCPNPWLAVMEFVKGESA